MQSHRHGPEVPGDVIHDHAGIALYLGGRTRMWMGATWDLQAGDLLVVPEGAPHRFVEAEDAHLVGLSLCTACLHEAWGAAFASVFEGVRRGEAPVRRLDSAAVVAFERALEGLEAELAVPSGHQALAVSGYLSVLAAAVLRATPAAAALPGRTEMPLVDHALDFIARHAIEGISLREVAQAVGRAPAHVAATMKAKTGRTVVDWITQARLAAVRQWLLGSDESVEGIALRASFSSLSHFHRTFRRVHGVSPEVWRRGHR